MPQVAHVSAIAYAIDRLENELDAHLSYHDVAHTRDIVLPAAEKFGRMANLCEEDMIILTTAAAYHDIGFLQIRKGHEAMSCDIARGTLTQFNYSEAQIEHVCQTIMATKIPQTPQDFLGELLADADMDVLGHELYFATLRGLFLEQVHFGEMIPLEDWKTGQVNFIGNHRYFSAEARAYRDEAKALNASKLLDYFDSGELPSSIEPNAA